MGVKIYHNPRCSKSRETLDILREKGIEPKVIEYLKDVPSEREIEMILMKLNMKAEDLIRKSEPLYKKKFKGLKLNDHEWIRVMHEHPELIERPIVIKRHKGVIPRPIERLDEIL